MSAEYIMSEGNSNMFSARGIRTFETATRTPGSGGCSDAEKDTHLPIIVISHATGLSYLVEPMAMAAAASGADGHDRSPQQSGQALSDGAQSVTPDARFYCKKLGE